MTHRCKHTHHHPNKCQTVFVRDALELFRASNRVKPAHGMHQVIMLDTSTCKINWLQVFLLPQPMSGCNAMMGGDHEGIGTALFNQTVHMYVT